MTASVLIVDDSADKLMALESILLDLHVNLVKAHSGKEALRRILSQDFAVILLDVRMPEMDGFETAAMIRQRARSEHTPIIFVTAYADETHLARGYSLKAVDYLMTPIVPEVLRTKVSVFVDLYQKTAQVKRQAESLRRRAIQLHGLTAAALDINSSRSVPEMLDVLADRARDILEVERALAVAEPDERPPVRAVSAAPTAPDDPDVDATVRAFVCRANRRYHAAHVDTRRDGRPGERHEIIAVPLVARDGRNLGLIQVSGRRQGGFAQEDEDLLVQLAQTTSIAIENTLFSEAREANRLKDHFLATVSHELRTPLSAIVSWASVLQRTGLATPMAPRALDAIVRNARAQARLVDDLLDVSRIATGKLPLRLTTVDLLPVAKAAGESASAMAEARHIRLTTTVDGSGPYNVRGDVDRLQQIIANLLANAIKFTPEGGTIDVRLTATDSHVELRVRDDGRGIPPAFLPHVFEPFRQADDSSSSSAGGLGLGLAIVQQLVTLHGGTVTAESGGEGHGATFTVRLPGYVPMDEAAGLASALVDQACGPVAATIEGLRILVVEDNPDTRDALCVTIAEAGASVRGVGTASEALATLGAWRPDAIVCDIGLPLESGYVLIRKIRSLPPQDGGDVPAIALTAYARGDDRDMALAAGFQRHMAKPAEPQVLLATLATIAAPRLEAARMAEEAVVARLGA